MKVKYNRAIGILLVSCGLFLLFSFLTLKNWPSLFTASIQLLVGVLFLTRPYFILEESSICLKPLIGPFKREISFSLLNPLILKGSTLFIKKEGIEKRLSVLRWLSSRADWERFIQEVQSRGCLETKAE